MLIDEAFSSEYVCHLMVRLGTEPVGEVSLNRAVAEWAPADA
jgi:hypothetical protein